MKFATLTFVAMSTSRLAFAADSAESEFREGRVLLTNGDYRHALSHFEASQRLLPSVGALLNIADCYAHLDRPASAYDTYRRAAEFAGRAKGDDRENLAREEMKRLESDIPRLRLSWVDKGRPAATFPRTFVLRLDGRVVPLEFSGVVLNLLPGPHVLVAEMEGRKSLTRELTSSERGTIEELAFDLLVLDGPQRNAPERDSEGSAQHTGETPNSLRTAGWALAIGGGVGVAAGCVFGGLALKENPSNRALEYSYAATFTFFPGLAVAAVGTAFIVLSSPKPASRAATIAPYAAPGSFGAGMFGRF